MSKFDYILTQCLFVGGIGWLCYQVALATTGKQAAKLIKMAAILIVVGMSVELVWDGINTVRGAVNKAYELGDRALNILEAPGNMADDAKDFLTRFPDQEKGRETIENFLLEPPDKERFWDNIKRFFFQSPKEWGE